MVYSQALGASGGSPPYAWSIASGSLPAGLICPRRDDLRNAWRRRVEQLHREGHRQRVGIRHGSVHAGDQSGGFEHYDVFAARGTAGTGLFAGARRVGWIAAVFVVAGSGSLPAGLELSAGGTISGTPGAAGSSSFTVRSRTAASVSATAPLIARINPPA